MRILIIEDDADFREILKTSLEAESFVVDTASDGTSGSYIARTNHYNLIILDYLLPGKNGDIVSRELRTAGIKTPILVMSVKTEVSDKILLLDSGADDYICKPFAFTELMARIRSVMRRPYETQSPTLTLDDLTIDTGAKEVYKSGSVVYLTRKEYMLLECMTRKCGKVVTRAEIVEEVWDNESNPFSNTVEAHIRNLRKKLRKNGSEKSYIHTIPGRGYKVDRVK
ncbi:MAG: response regulator transcription factor [Candidatus Pacebacteria bacterium]|nr:response regulator transcription factor [Candidatus Paceibacterota bacterium]